MRGSIAGRKVRCITPELQIRWHEYEGFDDVDWEDLQALCERFGLVQSRPGPPGFVHSRRPRLR